MTTYLIVMGWIATIVLGAAVIIALAVLIIVATQPRKAITRLPASPQVGEDVIAMHARWRDEQVTADLERILSEGDGR